MTISFANIPEVVIDYVRGVFAQANDKVTRVLSTHPSMHEESLDHSLITELTGAPPAFFSNERASVIIEAHWLGGRWMFGRWEIADIAIAVQLRQNGQFNGQKIVLLQTKRLYSNEIPVSELDHTDYHIGIGRLVDRADPIVPQNIQRAFGFDGSSVYGATQARHEQVTRIDEYEAQSSIPVYYGFYNPQTLPYRSLYPSLNGATPQGPNDIGCRIVPASHVHSVLAGLSDGVAPSADEMKAVAPFDALDAASVHGWRLEKFVADEVLRCRHGRLFSDAPHADLDRLLYRRSAPISSAVVISIDIGGGN